LPEREEGNQEIVHIDHAISPQAHTPMYLMHKYWARKPHNVVGEYIEHYSKKGEIVLDPFVGSGVTAIEALKRGRKALAIDLDSLSTFITRMTLKPINLKSFKDAFRQLEKSIRSGVEKLYTTTCPNCGQPCIEAYVVWSDVVECSICHEKIAMAKAVKKGKSLVCSSEHELNQNNVVGEEPIEIGCECKDCLEKSKKRVRFIRKIIGENDTEDKERLMKIAQQPIPHWYPKNVRLFYEEGKPFKKKESSNCVEDLFDKRSIIAHSMVYHEIERIEDEDIRDMMKFVFSSNLHNVSKLNVVHNLRLRMGVHPSRGWVMHSFWIPHIRIELPFWFYFKERFQHVLRGKRESNKVIPHYKEAKSYEDLKKDANILICTQSALRLDDAPAKIPNESVQYAFTDPPYGGSIQYMELSTIYTSWLKGEKNDPRFEMRYDKEITINDNQTKGFDYYHKMLKASFDQIFNVLESGRWLTVTFHNTDIKIYNSIIKASILAGFDLEKIIYQSPAVVSPKALLQPYGSAIGDYYIRFRKPEKKEKLLSDTEIDKERYERIVVDTVKHIIAERRESVTYSTIINSYPTIFAELKKNGYSFSAPEGIEEVLRKHLGKEFVLEDVRDDKGKVIGKKWWLKEKLFLDRASLSERVEATIIGVLNRRIVVSFDDILEEIFTKFQNALTPDTQSIKSILEEYAEKTDGKWQLKKEMRLRQSQHDQIIKWLAEIGNKTGFEVYADVPEYRGTKLDLPLPKDKIDRIRQIDAVWLKNNEIFYEFEVENSTGISDTIIRGSNIPSTNVKRFIVIPEERKNLLMMKVAEPILKENIEVYKWNFIFYDTFISFYEKNSHRKSVEAIEIDKLANLSTHKTHEQQTLSQFTSRSEFKKEE
jgi:DNA modification methylase